MIPVRDADFFPMNPSLKQFFSQIRRSRVGFEGHMDLEAYPQGSCGEQTV